MLVRWGQPERVCLAGLVHSAYSTEAYRFALFDRGERGRLRELVGPDAERLVFAFCACGPGCLLRADRGPAALLPVRGGGRALELDARDVAELLVVHAANAFEQACAPRGGPARCLSWVSRLIGAARSWGLGEDPPVFRGADAPLATREETALVRAYRRVLSRTGGADDQAVAADAFTSAPVGEPLVLAGIVALASADGPRAATLGERAGRLLDAWGAPWDKRLALDRWLELAAFVERHGRRRDAELRSTARIVRTAIDVARGSPARLWSQLDVLGALPLRPRSGDLPSSPRAAPPPSAAATEALPPRFAAYIAGLRANAERPMLQFYPGLRAQPWHDPREFPVVADLERHAAAIASEARAFDPARFQDEAEGIGRRGRWGVLFLLEMGRRNGEHLAQCPTLAGILERHRTLTTHAGLMYFSCLDPRSRVAPHRGPTNVRLRCHLGLEVPEAGCGIRVGGIAGAWQDGRCIVFDDSFEHDVWNDSDRRRVVLVIDLWHPDLSEDEVALLAGLHRYGAANESSAHRYWTRNDAALRRVQAPAAAAEDGVEAGDRADVDGIEELDAAINEALCADDLQRAGERAARYAELSRGTRFYPVPRDRDPDLPEPVHSGRVLTPAKLVHDIEQLRYLQSRGVVAFDVAPIVDAYEDILDTLRPLGADARVPLIGPARDKIGYVYARLAHVRETPRVARALSEAWAPAAVEAAYLDARPHFVVVDDFLSPEALREMRLFCLESTVWSTNRYAHGRLGSFFRDGFNCPLLIQIAEELRAAFPRIVGARHRLTQLWGYKHTTTQPALSPHADFAAVNVNFWITPDEANLDPTEGGLVVYDVDAPRDWAFDSYNKDARRIRAFLAERGAKATRIPYKCNRAVVFDSDLFHATPAVRFRDGYEQRRINVTALFGERNDA